MFKVVKELLEEVNCNVRFYVNYDSEFELTDWVEGFVFPVEGYIEALAVGPISLRDICWIEIHSIEERELGRLLPIKKINHIQFIESFLKKNQVEYIVANSIVKVENREVLI